jgi:hypothetical protein
MEIHVLLSFPTVIRQPIYVVCLLLPLDFHMLEQRLDAYLRRHAYCIVVSPSN